MIAYLGKFVIVDMIYIVKQGVVEIIGHCLIYNTQTQLPGVQNFYSFGILLQESQRSFIQFPVGAF